MHKKAPRISVTQMLCSNQWKDRWGLLFTHPLKLHHAITKNQKPFIPRATPENAQVAVSMPTPKRAGFSTETRSLLLMLSPTLNLMHLCNFVTYFIFLLEKKSNVLSCNKVKVLVSHSKVAFLPPQIYCFTTETLMNPKTSAN